MAQLGKHPRRIARGTLVAHHQRDAAAGAGGADAGIWNVPLLEQARSEIGPFSQNSVAFTVCLDVPEFGTSAVNGPPLSGWPEDFTDGEPMLEMFGVVKSEAST